MKTNTKPLNLAGRTAEEIVAAAQKAGITLYLTRRPSTKQFVFWMTVKPGKGRLRKGYWCPTGLRLISSVDSSPAYALTRRIEVGREDKIAAELEEVLNGRNDGNRYTLQAIQLTKEQTAERNLIRKQDRKGYNS